MWLSNSPDGVKSSYDEWFKRHCVIALRADDLGLDSAAMNEPMNLNLRNIVYYDFWSHPRTGSMPVSRERGDHRFADRGNYNLYVQPIYENRELLITSDGHAQEQGGRSI